MLTRLATLVGLAAVALGAAIAVSPEKIGTLGQMMRGWIPAGLLLLGVLRLVLMLEASASYMGPVLLIVIGGVALLIKENIFPSFDQLEAPFLIGIGGALVIVCMARATSTKYVDSFRTLALLGGRHVRAASRELEHISAVCILGRLDLDLREAEVASPGLDVHSWSIFGHIRIRVPDGHSCTYNLRFSVPAAMVSLPADQMENDAREEADVRVDDIRIYGLTSLFSSPSQNDNCEDEVV